MMIGFGIRERQHGQREEPDEPHPRRQRGHRAPAVQRDDRQQVEEVEEQPGEDERVPEVVAASLIAIGSSASAPSVPRTGPARPTRASAVALSPSDFAMTAAPRNGMNIGARRLDALAAQLDDVAHLVDEQQQHEADRELPAPDEAVGGDRDEHRPRGRQDLRLRQQQQRGLAELQQQRARRRRAR